jgi:sn-glycerol 3-phosphate transport system permease protein
MSGQLGVENFTRLLTSKEYHIAVVATAVFSAVTTTLALAAGLLLAVAAERTVRATGLYRTWQPPGSR